MIGLSLSLCIRDIINGKVDVDDVQLIRAQTKNVTDEEWQRTLDFYSSVYWKANPAGAIRAVHTLLSQGRIEQPRLRGEQPIETLGDWWQLSA